MSRPGTVSRPGEIDFGFLPYDSLETLVFKDKISFRWVKGVRSNEGEKERHPPTLQKDVILPLLAGSMKMVAHRHTHASYHNQYC